MNFQNALICALVIASSPVASAPLGNRKSNTYRRCRNSMAGLRDLVLVLGTAFSTLVCSATGCRNKRSWRAARPNSNGYQFSCALRG